MAPRGPQATNTVRSARLTWAIAALVALAAGVVALLLLAPWGDSPRPVGPSQPQVVNLTIDSRAVGRELDVNVVVPPAPVPPGERSLLVFLHGRGGSDESFVANHAFLSALAGLGRRAPLVAFPDGGVDRFWHDREDGDWGRYVTREVIPTVRRRFGADPRRVAIGGISMGGFGAYHLALEHPARFCATGGHSAGLWFEADEALPGAFDDPADFRRNDVLGAVRRDPEAFGSTPVWNDVGRSDLFRPYNEAFVAALRRGDAELTARIWPGGHTLAYWDSHWPDYLRFYADALARCG